MTRPDETKVELDELIGWLADADAETRARLMEEACVRRPGDASRIRAAVRRLEAQGLAAVADAGEPSLPERIGPFSIRGRLGSGGMGVVYRALDPEFDREVALKVVRWDASADLDARRRFETEVLAAARLEHAGIVPVHRVGSEEGIAWFAMSIVEGRTLAEVLRELAGTDPARLDGGALARAVDRDLRADDTDAEGGGLFDGPWPSVCARIALRIADALTHAHLRGVLHRDVKPSNVMVTPTGRVLLLDFGLAQLEGDAGLTRTRYVVGSLPYMSPEQLAGDAVDARSDVYALGLMLWEMLALRHPFPDRERGDRDPAPAAPPLRPIDRRISWEMETVVSVALDPEPGRRYPTARAMAADLTRALDGGPVTARRPGPVLRARRFVRRHPTITTASALVAALVLVLGVALREQHADAERLRDSLDVQQALARSLMGLVDTEFDLLDPDRAGGPEVDLDRLYESRCAAAERLTAAPAQHASFLLGLGRVARVLRRNREAYAHDTKALDLLTRHTDGDSQAIASCIDSLAEDARRLRRLDEAELLGRRSLSMRTRLFGPQTAPVAKSLQTLALVHDEQGRYAEARQIHERILEILNARAEDEGSPPRERLAVALHNAAGFELRQSYPAKAARLAQQSVQLFEDTGAGASNTASALLTLGLALTRRGLHADAAEALVRARRLALNVYGPDHLLVWQVEMARGDLLVREGRPVDAVDLAERAVAGLARAHGNPAHPDVVRARAQLALTLLSAGRDDEAESQVRTALDAPRSEPLVEAGLRDVLARVLQARDRASEVATERKKIVALYAEAYGANADATWQMRSPLLGDLAKSGAGTEAVALARSLIDRALLGDSEQHRLLLGRLLHQWPRVLTGLSDTDALLEIMDLHERLIPDALARPTTSKAALQRVVTALRMIGEGQSARDLAAALHDR